MSYTDVFGGANVYPSEISYSFVDLTVDIFLSWPEETSTNVNLATRIMDVDAATAGLSIYLPGAQKAGNGETILFNNVGASAFIVKNYDGTQIVSIDPGIVWQVYLTDNTTDAGAWIALQYGAAISSANASALAGTGLIAIGTLLSQAMPVTQFNSDYIAGANDRSRTYIWDASGSGAVALPDPATVGNNWFMNFRNAGGGEVVFTPAAGSIDGGATKTYQPQESSIIVSDGSDFYTIGFGQSAIFVFDYTVISIAGTGNYTLSGSELNRIAYKFTGVLTGNRTVIVPDTVQQYWVDNATTGSYTLTVRSTTGTGPTIGQNQRAIFYCNGADVVDADTSTVSTPFSIAQGGTGAVTAGGALINLGGTSVGISLFTAVDAAAAWAALGPLPAGAVDGGTF